MSKLYAVNYHNENSIFTMVFVNNVKNEIEAEEKAEKIMNDNNKKVGESWIFSGVHKIVIDKEDFIKIYKPLYVLENR